MNLSYWESKILIGEPDFIIIGAGITGMITALEIKSLRPHSKILLLDRGYTAGGASTRNAGFACFGSLSELCEDEQTMGVDKVIELVSMRIEGLKRLMTWCEPHAIEYRMEGSHELFLESHRELADAVLPKLQLWNSLLSPVLNGTAFEMTAPEKLPGNGIMHALFNPHEGSINTGRLIQDLQRKLAESGCSFLTGIKVTHWHERDNYAEVSTEIGKIRCGILLFATNGFTRHLLPELEVYPARNQVLVTSVIPKLSWKGTYHLDRGYFYFRELDGRILIGGGRHLAGSSENSDIPNTTQDVLKRLEILLRNHILPGIDFKIEMQWAGILGIGPNREVIVQKTGERSACAVRLGGMGVALGSLMGKKLAEIALKIES